MIIWLSGAFGVGKSTVAAAMTALAGTMAPFDPEELGPLVTRVRPAPSGDFQDLPAWRRLVVSACAELAEHADGPLVVPMSILDETYAREIFGGLRARRHQLAHVVLDCEQAELVRRIDGDRDDTDAAVWMARREWRHAHRTAYYRAAPWLHRLLRPLVVDTTSVSAIEVARRVLRWAGIPPADPLPDYSAGPPEPPRAAELPAYDGGR